MFGLGSGGSKDFSGWSGPDEGVGGKGVNGGPGNPSTGKTANTDAGINRDRQGADGRTTNTGGSTSSGYGGPGEGVGGGPGGPGGPGSKGLGSGDSKSSGSGGDYSSKGGLDSPGEGLRGGLGDISRAQADAASRAASAAAGSLGGLRGGMVGGGIGADAARVGADSGGMLSREFDRDRQMSSAPSYDRTAALAETGATAREMQMAQQRRAAENKPQQTEALAFGTNNFDRPEVAVAALDAAVKNAKQQGRVPVAVLPNPSNPKTAAVAQAMAARAKELGIDTVTPTSWAADGIHPASYAELGKRFDGAVVRGDSIAEGIIGAQQSKSDLSYGKVGASSDAVLGEIQRMDSPPGQAQTRTVDPGGFQPGEIKGGMVGPDARAMDMAQQRRASEDVSMRSLDKMQNMDQAQAARASEIESMKALARENLLGTLRGAEATKNANPYESLVGNRTVPGLTDMTIGQVKAYQAKLKGNKAIGAYQLIQKTLPVAQKLAGLTDDDKFTPQNQDKMALALASMRMDKARKADGTVDENEFAHELANEWAGLATPKTGKSAHAGVGNNKASVGASKTLSLARDLISNDALTGDVRVSGAPGTTKMGTGKKTSSSNFTDKYLSKTYSDQLNTGPASPTDDYFGPKVDQDKYMVDEIDQAPKTVADRPIATVPDGTPVTPASADAGVFGNEPVKKEGDFPDRPRSTGEKLAALGIDIGAGMLPGAGLGISLINGGLALTGNRTLGERIVDAAATGEGGTFAGYGEGDPNRRDLEKTNGKGREPDKPKTTTTAKTFEDKYLAFVDPVKRPTPDQRWGVNSDPRYSDYV